MKSSAKKSESKNQDSEGRELKITIVKSFTDDMDDEGAFSFRFCLLTFYFVAILEPIITLFCFFKTWIVKVRMGR